MVNEKYEQIKTYLDSSTLEFDPTENETSDKSRRKIKLYSAISRHENGSYTTIKNPYKVSQELPPKP